MKFPYGLSNFCGIISEGYFYVDRTDRIPLIEEAGTSLILLRPRRFGKSLLLSMLKNYYDVAQAEAFPRLFGHLAIGRNPTPQHNQYFVLHWDFSVVSPLGTPEDIQRALHDYLNGSVRDFAEIYRDHVTREIVIHPTNAISSLQSLMTAIHSTPHKLYLLIDEYDNFANEVMMSTQESGLERYKSLVQGEGCLKVLFKFIKSISGSGGLGRTFITGVSPVVMSDLTSGYNIAENIYLKPQFNDVCGFSEAEITPPLTRLAEEHQLSSEQVTAALETMRIFYKGYCFCEQRPQRVYNPTLTLYFLKSFQQEGQYPRRMLDSNLAMDRGKIAYISRRPNGEQVILDALTAEPPVNITELSDRFGVEDMLAAVKDRTFMVSFLYFFGVLTLTDQHTDFGNLVFTIPNLVIRKLYVERMREILLPEPKATDDARSVAEQFYRTGDIQPVCAMIERRYFPVFDNRDYRWANELTVKTAFLTFLFNDTFYIMDSETTLERGYADFTMLVRPDMRQYRLLDFLIEFKYVILADVGLKREELRQISPEDLRSLAPVRARLTEARSALVRYQQAFTAQYGGVLRLRTYSVVAVGFDRLVYEEILS